MGELSPATMGHVFLSGVFAAGFNVLRTSVAQRLSASHTAFASNFNRAATIIIAICMGMEALPVGWWGVVMLLAVLGNIGAFTSFSLLKAHDKAAGKDAGESDAKSVVGK